MAYLTYWYIFQEEVEKQKDFPLEITGRPYDSNHCVLRFKGDVTHLGFYPVINPINDWPTLKQEENTHIAVILEDWNPNRKQNCEAVHEKVLVSHQEWKGLLTSSKNDGTEKVYIGKPMEYNLRKTGFQSRPEAELRELARWQIEQLRKLSEAYLNKDVQSNPKDPVIAGIDQYLKENNLPSTNPVDANRYLSEKGILNDNPSTPGLPLRKKIWNGEISHAYQEGRKNSAWIIPHSYYGPFYNSSYLSKEQFKEGLMKLAKDTEMEILKAFFHFDNCEANGDAVRAILGKTDIMDINREIGSLCKRLASHFEIPHFSKEKGERMKFWNVCFQGRREGQWFIWILRRELKDALIELGLDSIPYPGEEIQSFQKTYHEGGKTTVQISRVERSSDARTECLAKYGYQCQACGMSFLERYGEVAKDFIHVHHKHPVSQKDEPSAIKPERDLVPLCPNCHAVAHMRKPEPYSVEEIKTMLNEK